MTRQQGVKPALVVAGVVLIGAGFLAIFSIGLPILVAGLFVLVAGVTGAHRTHPTAFWPSAAGAAAFLVAYVLVAPLACTTRAVTSVDGTAGADEAVGSTTCTNVVGIDYSGGAGYAPPLWPAALTGAASALAVGAATRLLLSERGES